MSDPQPPMAQVLAETRAWVDHAVIGLNLCPFAKAVQVKHLLRYAGTEATDTDALLHALLDELMLLKRTPADELETTVLVAPRLLADFEAFNAFCAVAEATVQALGLAGEIQVAHFHPAYRFEGTTAEDIGNATNRSPWPTLHLIREASIDRAVAAFPEAQAIYQANIATLRRLGADGWAQLQARWRQADDKRDTAAADPAAASGEGSRSGDCSNDVTR